MNCPPAGTPGITRGWHRVAGGMAVRRLGAPGVVMPGCVRATVRLFEPRGLRPGRPDAGGLDAGGRRRCGLSATWCWLHAWSVSGGSLGCSTRTGAAGGRGRAVVVAGRFGRGRHTGLCPAAGGPVRVCPPGPVVRCRVDDPGAKAANDIPSVISYYRTRQDWSISVCLADSSRLSLQRWACIPDASSSFASRCFSLNGARFSLTPHGMALPAEIAGGAGITGEPADRV